MINWRANIVFTLIFFFGLGIVTRLFFIQVQQADFFKALAQGLYSLEGSVWQERGEIFFQGGEPLAINMERPLVFASPQEVEDKEETAEVLASILSLDKDFLLAKLQKENLYNLYEPLKKKLTEEEIEKINNLKIKGIYLGKEKGRYYPQETMASQLVGFLDAEQKGQYGLEYEYDDVLQGRGQDSGDDLILTLDYSIQFKAEELLEEAKESLDIEGGSIIVLEPDSGKILALANFPNFNPNSYSKIEDFDIFQNSLTQKIFEPGSVFKPITMAAAINEEAVTPQTTYQDPGKLVIGGWPIYNYEQRVYPGDITMTEVLEKSINTGAVFAERQLGNNLFYSYIEKFGIFESTGIDLQETIPVNKEFHEGWGQGREINFATAAYGQGIEMTPIQLIKAYSAIANGGKITTPYLVEKIVSADEVKEIKPESYSNPLISSKTASQLTAMLISVVENGFAKSAQIPGYYVAGKTGTAQIAFSALDIPKEGYSDQTWQTFVGFAPAFNPKFLILVKLDNPETKTAEYSAVPLFHDLAKYIIDYYQIAPDFNE